MARYILHIQCAEKMKKLAKDFNEYFEESEVGEAKKIMWCDSCGEELYEGASCVAAVLLPTHDRQNAEHQHPKNWAGDFIKI